MTVSQAGQALRHLLLLPAMRPVWARHVVRAGPTEPHQRVVATALALACLGDAARVAEVRDRVADALRGRRITAATIDDFTATFAFAPETVQLLQALIIASSDDGASLLSELVAVPGPRPYRTVQLHEVHELGPDGWPFQHTTTQTIEALVDPLTEIDYIYIPGENAAKVTVVAGGTAGEPRPVNHPDHPGAITTTITLTEPLKIHQPHELVYRTAFAYSAQPEQAFRRGLSPQVEVIAIKVVFDRTRLPAYVWETEWDGPEGHDVIDRRRVHLGAGEPSVELLRRRPGERWLGYTWEW